MSFEHVLRCLKPREGDLTRFILVNNPDEIAELPTIRVDPKPTKVGVKYRTEYPTWDPVRRVNISIPRQRLESMLSVIEARRSVENVRPGCVPRFTVLSSELSPLSESTLSLPTRQETTQQNVKEFPTTGYNNNPFQTPHHTRAKPSVAHTPYHAAIPDDSDLMTPSNVLESHHQSSKPAVSTVASEPLEEEDSENIFGNMSTVSVYQQRQPSRALEHSDVEAMEGSQPRAKSKSNANTNNHYNDRSQPRSISNMAAPQTPYVPQQQQQSTRNTEYLNTEESTNIFGTFSTCSVYPNRAPSQPMMSTCFTPLSTNVDHSVVGASKQRETIRRAGTTICQSLGFRSISSNNPVVELAHFQSEIEENYEAVGNVVVDLMGGCDPTLRVGRVQLGNDIFTLREEIRATELKRVLYVGTTEGDEFPVVVYAWTNGNSYESAKAFVASQGLNVPCRIVGYRSYDKMSGYTAIIFPQGHVYSLRTFLQRSVPTRATETALYYVAETLRSLCTRRIIHCALTPDNVFMYMDSTGASLKTFPVCWDDCVDAAMFSERGLKFVPSLPVLMRHAVKEIDGSYIDFVSFCRMFRQIENNCSAMCQKVAKMKAPPVVRMTDYTNIQTELTWDMDAVMNHFC